MATKMTTSHGSRNLIVVINRINKTVTGPARLPKPCKFCGGLGHLAFGCTKKPRKPLKAKRSMKKIGRVGRATMQSNKEFLDSIPDEELYCYYCAYTGVHILLMRSHANAEHYYSRARHPELRNRNDLKVVSCDFHNADKGSLDGDDYLKILDERKRG